MIFQTRLGHRNTFSDTRKRKDKWGGNAVCDCNASAKDDIEKKRIVRYVREGMNGISEK